MQYSYCRLLATAALESSTNTCNCDHCAGELRYAASVNSELEGFYLSLVASAFSVVLYVA